MRTYTATRGTGRFVAFIGWAVVGVGGVLLILALGSTRSGFGILALAPAFGIMVGGLLLVCQGQLIQALADTAMNTGTLVELLRGSASHAQPAPEVAPVATAPPEQLRNTMAPTAPPPPPLSTTDASEPERAKLDPRAPINIYQGYTVFAIASGEKITYETAGKTFQTLEESTSFIDSLLQPARR